MSLAQASKIYGPVPDEKFPTGTIILDAGNYYVYRVEGNGSATRYGANVGRDGFRWSG
jgi:lipoprotein-anchoring transpeptidase ErfK/SrfK